MPESPSKSYTYVLGLGSNLGDRLKLLRDAADAIECNDMKILRRSNVYTSMAHGPPQPDYLNAAILIVTRLQPADLLGITRAVEVTLGRTRPDAVRWGPRTIDIDILWWSEGVAEQPSLNIPHPRLAERPFALQPLVDVAPGATDPSTGRSYKELPAADSQLDTICPL